MKPSWTITNILDGSWFTHLHLFFPTGVMGISRLDSSFLGQFLWMCQLVCSGRRCKCVSSSFLSNYPGTESHYYCTDNGSTSWRKFPNMRTVHPCAPVSNGQSQSCYRETLGKHQWWVDFPACFVPFPEGWTLDIPWARRCPVCEATCNAWQISVARRQGSESMGVGIYLKNASFLEANPWDSTHFYGRNHWIQLIHLGLHGCIDF